MRTGRTVLPDISVLASWTLGCRVVWLAWFGVANRVVYEVRSGREYSGLIVVGFVIRG